MKQTYFAGLLPNFYRTRQSSRFSRLLPAHSGRWSLLLLVLLLNVATQWPAAAQVAGRAQPPRFFRADAEALSAATRSPLTPRLRQYRAYSLDLAGLRAALAAAPLRSASAAQPVVLSLPMPDGTSQRFAVWETPLLAPALAAQYPTLHTYGGRGLDDPTALLSLTSSPSSFQAQILTDQPNGAAYLEAAGKGDARHYLSYFAHDVTLPAGGVSGCGAGSLPVVPQPAARRRGGPSAPGDDASNRISPVGPTLTVYRLIVTTTKEYTNSVHNVANGADYTDVLADITGLVNNVRTIQERDLAVTMTVVGTHFYTTASDGGYNQANDMQMIDQNRINVETQFGAATFDLGHLFATSGSGLAYTGVVGTTATGGTANTYKAGAVSGNAGRTTPASYFSTSVVAHEMGHQFSASHTFNVNNGSCGGTARTAATAWEPGKGSTIMAYTDGGCGPNASITTRSDAYYHTGSIEQMRTYIENTPAVGTAIASSNSPPTVVVPANRSIPQGTPFKLTATGTDAADGPTLAYNWEELDLGSAADLTTAQAANDNVPLFRSVLPTASGTRYFPSLSNLGGSSSSSTTLTERLPTVARTLSLRCTVRDNHTVTGAVATSTNSGIVGGVTLSRTVVLSVSAANATPFAVTAPNSATTWAAGSTQSVTWNGVGTKTSAVNCQGVNVRLSTDGGATYPTVLAAGVPNADGTGTANITLPNVATTTARIMVEAADNYFFDISDVNFTITSAGSGPAITSLSPTSGPAGSTLTLNGSGFGTNASDLTVTVGAVAAPITGTVTDNSFSVVVPTTALTGAVVVTKTGTGAGTTNGGVFQVTPVVLSVSPTSGAVGTSVVISGNSFGGATRVTFNDTETTAFTLDAGSSPNTITVAVPVGATTGTLVVYTAGGASTGSVVFTVVPFAVSSIVPALNARAATEFSNVAVAFNATADATNSTLAPIRVTSLQSGGRKAGSTTVAGNTVTFDPSANFRAGEVVQVSVTTAAISSANAALSQGYVSQFTVRSQSTSGVLAGSDYAVGNQPDQVVAGNLNANAALDLVVVNQTDGTVSVLLNNGTGTGFTAATGSPITVGTSPRAAVLADLNNDGNLDLLVACNGSGTVEVLQGNGDGTFTTQASVAATNVQMVTVGDLNGDGNLDLVAPRFSNPGSAVIGLGNGSFGFSTSTYSGLVIGPVAVALADFNEDGKLDLAAASSTGSNNGSVSVRLGDGTGSFAGGTDLTALGTNYVVAADLTGDGHLDLAATNPYASGAPLKVWAGTGTGAFGSAVTLSMSVGYTYTLSTGDYNGDGVIDLIAPRSGLGATAGVDAFAYNSSTSTFSAPTTIVGFGNQPRFVSVADINNDRTLDFVTANSVGGNSVSVALAIASAPLPVELVSFAAERRGAAVALAWRTASELHNAGFVVERSLDGQKFQAMSALLPGLGNSTMGQLYAYLDPAAPTSVIYYRLRQVDKDGPAHYSLVATVAALASSATSTQLLVYPNPARLAAFVQLSGPVAAGAAVQVLDALGRQVRHAQTPPVGMVLEVSLRGLPAGLYVVRCGALSQRLVVE